MGMIVELLRGERKPGSVNHLRLPLGDLSPNVSPISSPTLHADHIPHTPRLRVHTANHMERTPFLYMQPHTPDSEPGRHTRTLGFTVTLTKRDNMGTYKAGSTSSAQRHTPTVSGSPHKPLDEAIPSDTVPHTHSHMVMPAPGTEEAG